MRGEKTGPRWQDSRWLNWRVSSRLCIRLMPGLWVPAVYWQKPLRYFAIVLPFLGITFDYLALSPNGGQTEGDSA